MCAGRLVVFIENGVQKRANGKSMIRDSNSLVEVADPVSWPVGGNLKISNHSTIGKVQSLYWRYLLGDAT